METSVIGQTRKKLGDILVDAGLIDQKILFNALEIQKVQKKRIGQILINMRVADDEEIAKALARQLKIPFMHLGQVEIELEILALIPPAMVENYLLIPIRKTDGNPGAWRNEKEAWRYPGRGGPHRREDPF
jgi:type IV pilus assembly protein PilB